MGEQILEVRRYDNIVIDPPWPKRKGGIRNVRPNQGRVLSYPVMSVAEIFALIDRIVLVNASECHNLWLWGIDQFLHEGEQELLRRGYRLHARIIWDKENGVAPAFTIRYSHEYLSWMYLGKFLPVAIAMRGVATTVIRSKSREHSRKPDEAYEMIRKFYPESPRIDVFSREKRNGWDQYGNEPNYFNR